MKNKNQNHFRAEVSEAREEGFCSNPDCKDRRLHITELVNLNAEYKGLKYNSPVCVPCQKGIHLVVEAKTILKKGANENNS